MMREKLIQLVQEIHKRRTDLLLSKGQDYANDQDVLDNFKRMRILCNILDIDVRRSYTDCALFLVVLKIDRWCNLRTQDKLPSNESILDSVCDLHNYIDLAFACSGGLTDLKIGEG